MYIVDKLKEQLTLLKNNFNELKNENLSLKRDLRNLTDELDSLK